MSRPAFEVIADPRSTEIELESAIRSLGPPTEPPTMWMSIAANESYPRSHRRHFVFQLLNRHFRLGSTLGQLAVLLDQPPWLRENNVTLIEDLGGHVPVRLAFDRTVLVLDILPEQGVEPWRVYLAIASRVSPGDLFALLKYGQGSEATLNARVIEIGFSPAIVSGVPTSSP